MEMKKDKVMGIVLTEAEKERQANFIVVSFDLIKNLLGKEKISVHDFGINYMHLKHYDYEELENICKNLSKEELEKFPSMGLDMGVFKNNQNEYISVYDVDDIREKSKQIAKESLVESVKNLIRGNKEIKNSKSVLESLKVHFKWSEKFQKENLVFKGKDALEFVNKLIETDNIYSKERINNKFQDTVEGCKPYYKTNLTIEYSGIEYEIKRMYIGDGIYNDLNSFIKDREKSFDYISTQIENLRGIISDEIIDDFKNNYNKLFQEMREYTPKKLNFKSSDEAFGKVESTLVNKESQFHENWLKKEYNNSLIKIIILQFEK